MTETIRTAMDRLMTTAAEPQDYVAEDGLLYCGSCNTPKEAFFPNGRKLFGRDRHPAECLCRQAVREKQEAEEKARLHHENVRRLKLQGFQTIIPTAAAVLSKKRQMLRLTQQEIADRAKITLRQYQRLESGERSILTCSFGLACRVIEALDMDISKFYHGDYYLEELKTIEGK